MFTSNCILPILLPRVFEKEKQKGQETNNTFTMCLQKHKLLLTITNIDHE